jgi:hypothetical protein
MQISIASMRIALLVTLVIGTYLLLQEIDRAMGGGLLRQLFARPVTAAGRKSTEASDLPK